MSSGEVLRKCKPSRDRDKGTNEGARGELKHDEKCAEGGGTEEHGVGIVFLGDGQMMELIGVFSYLTNNWNLQAQWWGSWRELLV